MKKFNILVIGTGAVGIYFGGKLFKAGFNVVFVDLPDRVEKLNQTGLKIVSKIDHNIDFQPKIVDQIVGLPSQDLILICVKAYHTYEIALNLLPVIKPSSILLSLQNGLENEKILSQILGKSLIMGAVPFFNGNVKDDYIVNQNAPAQIIYGEMDHQQSTREDWVSQVLAHADINHTISRSIRVEIWKNFIWNNAFNTISALTKTTFGQIVSMTEVLPTIKQMMKETQQVASAEGYEITNQQLDDLINFSNQYSNVNSNMQMDIESRSTPELEALVGVLLKKAKTHGITAIVNQTIYNLLQLSLSNIDINVSKT
jgi:2-dehydropantoate 2-reductase